MVFYKPDEIHADCCGVNHPPNECPGYDTKLPDGVTPVLELWEMLNTPSLPLLLDPHRVVVSIRVPSMPQIELFNRLTVCKLMNDVKLNC